jgi:hypothetical protein
MPTFGGIVVPTGGAAEGRRPFLEIINELVRPVDASSETLRALAADAFRSAVRTMNRKGSWPWEIQDEDVSITATERFSTVSSAVKKPLAMHLLNSAGGTRDQGLSYVAYERFVEKFNLDINSEPHTYTIPNLFETSQIRWHPIPSSDDNARFTYYRVTPAPRAEQEPVEIPDFATEPYMAYAWLEFLKRLPSEQRPFPITVAMSQAQTAFREISAHVVSPGDRTRQISGGGYGF